MDNVGAIFGPLLAIGLVALVGVRWAIGLSVIPGLLAAVAIVYAIRRTRTAQRRERRPIRLRFGAVLRGDLGRLMAAVAAFEVGNVAATLLILRATQVLTPEHGTSAATRWALWLYVGYNVAAALAAIPAGRLADRIGNRGPILVLAGGVAMFGAAYTGFGLAGASLGVLAIPFMAAGVAVGAVETAEHAAVAALAPERTRGSAFGLLAAIQAVGNVAASAVAGILWTAISPRAAFAYLVAWMVLALAGLTAVYRVLDRGDARRPGGPPKAP